MAVCKPVRQVSLALKLFGCVAVVAMRKLSWTTSLSGKVDVRGVTLLHLRSLNHERRTVKEVGLLQ